VIPHTVCEKAKRLLELAKATMAMAVLILLKNIVRETKFLEFANERE
jgi:hypothetical protein